MKTKTKTKIKGTPGEEKLDKRLIFALDEKLYEEIRRLAEFNERSMSAEIRVALKDRIGRFKSQ